MIQKLLAQVMRTPLGLRLVITLLCIKRGRCLLIKDGDTYLLRKGRRQIRMAGKHLLFTYGTAEHFDTYFSQTVPELIGGFSEVDYSRPKLHQMASGLEFELSGLPEEADVMGSYFRQYKPMPGDLVFDIGAYCGISTFHLSELVGSSGKVIAFEPDPLNFQLLRRNLERHGLVNVTVVQVAVSDRDGSAAFKSDGNLSSGLTSAFDIDRDGSEITVPMMNFEQACLRYGVPRFVKIDAEGAEIEIIGAAKEFLKVHPINFVLDTCHIRNGIPTAGPIEQLFLQCGYAVESAKASGFMTTWAGPAHSGAATVSQR